MELTGKQSSALDTQVDGNHYKEMFIQPIELAYLVGGTPCFCKLAKYITRNKGDKKINLDKAIHCIRLEQEFYGKNNAIFTKHYPVTSDADYEIAAKFIDIFSEDEIIRSALKNMFSHQYSLAIDLVETLKEKLDA